ncbi:hypothetical protein LCGC14_0514530 [marine sediment metagenome]|uniref:Zinc finger CHC2-type domain-containing protein n=1 Tax=marine sediment metagenome TaxID=412755 RepID=A0A0F9S516_9ZZZZ
MNGNAIEIVQFMKSKGVELRIEGGMFVGDCPFCNKHDSLWVTPTDQAWSCSNEECLQRIKGEQQWLNLFYFARYWTDRRGQLA